MSLIVLIANVLGYKIEKKPPPMVGCVLEVFYSRYGKVWFFTEVNENNKQRPRHSLVFQPLSNQRLIAIGHESNGSLIRQPLRFFKMITRAIANNRYKLTQKEFDVMETLIEEIKKSEPREFELKQMERTMGLLKRNNSK